MPYPYVPGKYYRTRGASRAKFVEVVGPVIPGACPCLFRMDDDREFTTTMAGSYMGSPHIFDIMGPWTGGEPVLPSAAEDAAATGISIGLEQRRKEVEALTADLATTRKALVKYGAHLHGCNLTMTGTGPAVCNCGLTAALKAQP